MTEQQALTQIIKLISRWKPLPEKLTSQLDQETLRKVLKLVRQLQDQGLSGAGYKTPARLAAMQKIIESWTAGPAQAPQIPPQQRAAESLAFRTIHGQTALDQRRTLTELRKRP
jgi:hypothetical protein